MKKLFSAFLALPMLLTSCVFKDDGWKEYETPELFLAHAVVHSYITVTSSKMDFEVMDYDLNIRDAILEMKEFTSVKNIDNKSDHYITYKILISLATSGPNYSNMYIYDDGNMQIDYKASLGSLHSFYYTFDSTKAPSLVDKIEQQIEENIEKEQSSSSLEN